MGEAAKRVNQLCKEKEIPLHNPRISSIPAQPYQGQNKTSIYIGVCWSKIKRKWQTLLAHNKKQYCGGHFDHEEDAAMKVNLLCDKYKIERKNPTINIELDEIQQEVPKIKKTSQYKGV